MPFKVPLPDLSELLPTIENDEGPSYYVSQTVPVLLSPKDESADCYSMYAAQQGIARQVSIKRHSFDLAFALTDYKLQGRTLPKLIISVCKRKRMPWMTLQSFYVLVSRTTTMAGLRLLQYDNVGLDSLRKQMPDKYLYAWERGYDDNGKWNDNLAVTALRNIRNVQQIEKKTLATKNKTQSLTTNKHNSPAKNSLQPGEESPSSSPHKRQKRYTCGLCKSTDHTKLKCPQRPVVLSARKLF
jgi:hypothetical protein